MTEIERQEITTLNASVSDLRETLASHIGKVDESMRQTRRRVSDLEVALYGKGPANPGIMDLVMEQSKAIKRISEQEQALETQSAENTRFNRENRHEWLRWIGTVILTLIFAWLLDTGVSFLG